jgi:exodeoxyribonuclease VIII
MSQALPEGTHDIADEVYHRRELGIASKSTLDMIHRSPAHYKAWVDGAVPDEDRAALVFGRAFHVAVLEPEKWAANYASLPSFGDGRTKEAKARKATWLAVNEGRIAVPEADYETIEAMAMAVRAHPLASKLVTGGKAEQTLRWCDEATGLQCKSRVDYIAREGTVFVDLKSCANADFNEFRRS